jgi:leader peptidase (prepilin peptidase)/N-methyltransferase
VDPLLAAVVFAPALALGSFLNVVAAREPTHRSVVSGRSACLSCGEQIRWYDNIPMVSYVVLRGRCRACGAAIGIRYLAVELLTAVLVAACLAHFGLTAEGAVAAFFVAVLVLLSAIDIECRILPDRIVLPGVRRRAGGQLPP